MKRSLSTILIILISLTTGVFAQESGVEKKALRNFNLGIALIEIGKTVSLKQKRIETLNYSLDKFMANIKGNVSVNFIGLSLYYKDKIGVEALVSNTSTVSDGVDFKNYLSDKYPGYFIPDWISSYSSTNTSAALRMCYRKHFHHFFIEPKFQVMFNSFDNNYNSFKLKEMGTNQYVEYSITDEFHGAKNSYHLICNIAKRFDPFKDIAKVELGLMGEFMIAPIHQSVTVTEAPYGQVGTTNTETFKLYNPSFNFALTLKVFLEHRN